MLTGTDASSSDVRPADRLIRSAREGDVARRLQAEVRHLAVAIPITTAAALTAAVVAPFFGGSRNMGVALLGAGALVSLVLVLRALRPRDLDDDAVRSLDGAAGLEGQLRSGYWFATHDSADATGDIWVTHHLEDAAARVSAVSWSVAYPRPRAARSWAVAAVLALATLMTPGWSRLIRQSGPADSAHSSGPVVEASGLAGLESATVPELLDAFRAMKSGGVPSRRSLAAVEHAMQEAGDNAALQAQLQELFDRADAGDDGSGEFDDESGLSDERREQMARNREDERMSRATMARLQWAVQDARTRAATATPQDGDAGAAKQNNDDVIGAEQQQRQQQSAATGTTEDQSGARQMSDQLSSRLDTGRGSGYQSHSTENDPAAQAAAKAATAHLAEALRKEVVQASADQAGSSVHAGGARRTTDSGTSSGSNGSAAAARADAGSSAAVRSLTPVARQRLVRDYFSRTSTASPGVP